MKTGRLSSIISFTIAFSCLLAGAAHAGFGFGEDERGKSGLDFNRGYDVNTVSSVSGRVLSAPQPGEKDYVFMEIRVRGETISLCLGPRSYLGRNEIPLRPNDDVMVKGSKAQGNDGRTYLIVQKIENRATGSHVVLRNDQGNPAWSQRNGNGMMWGRGGGMMNRGMMRGGGMTGGGMRR